MTSVQSSKLDVWTRFDRSKRDAGRPDGRVVAISAEDRLAVIELINEYAYCVDTKRVSGLDRVFADDAVVDLGYGRWTGLTEIRPAVDSIVAQFHSSAHAITNVRVTEDGERLRSSAYVTAWHWMPSRVGPDLREADFVFIAAYLDEFRQVPSLGWRIVHRRARRLGPSVLASGVSPDFMLPLQG